MGNRNISSLAFDSGHNVLYAATSGPARNSQGVWKYNGAAWTDTGGEEFSNEGPINSLAYDSVHNLLYASGYGVWKYDGTAWTNTGGELKGWSVESLAYDPVRNLLYAGTDGVWKYDGTAWTPANEGLWSNGFNYAYVSSLAFDSADNVLYSGTYSYGVWKYDGTRWTDTGGKVSKYDIYSLAYDSSHKALYAGCDINNEDRGKGVWKYDGKSWVSTGGGVSKYKISSLAYDPLHNALYAGTYDSASTDYQGPHALRGQGVWKYDGKTWTNIGGGTRQNYVISLALNPTTGVLYAGRATNGALNAGKEANGVWSYAASCPSRIYRGSVNASLYST